MEATAVLRGNRVRARLRLYWPLIKSLQTGLLLVTGIAGYMSARCSYTTWQTVLALADSLALAISGSTVLNMWYDRNIDARMARTMRKPIPSGNVTPAEALRLGLVLATAGVAWAVALDPLYGLIVFAGLFFDVAVYTIWLKRRTPWAIIWGGISGGMPVLAGRVLGAGQFEWIGLALSLAVLFWIPTHILTFNIRYRDDYDRAAVAVVRLVGPGQLATATLTLVHGIAGLIIFALPLYVAARGALPPGFALVAVGGALIGLAGVLLSFLKAGRPLLPEKTILSVLPSLLVLVTGAFVAGFAWL